MKNRLLLHPSRFPLKCAITVTMTRRRSEISEKSENNIALRVELMVCNIRCRRIVAF
uniref:Uncharacterized protein n=1 Tax=Anguilla anguilla TaxID=7936 RepID=A0A0E9SYG3_ANGAN